MCLKHTSMGIWTLVFTVAQTKRYTNCATKYSLCMTNNSCNTCVLYECVMAEVAYLSESSSLLASTVSEEDSSSLHFNRRMLASHVLHWNISVCHPRQPFSSCCGRSSLEQCIIIYYVIGFSALLVFSNPAQNAILLQYEPLSYVILALVMMFYPLSGFIADICCGRLKAVVISLPFILSCWIIVLIALSLFMSMSKPDISSLQHNQGLVVAILCFISLFTFIIGLVGYQANFIQLGLDQLFEAPSQYLALFIHYAMWVFNISSLHFIAMAMCFSYENK